MPFTADVQLDNSCIEGRGYSFNSPCHIVGKMLYEFERLRLIATVTVAINAICDACAEEFEYKFRFDIDEMFSNEISESTYYGINPTSIDIDKPLIDNLIFYLPTRLLCKPNCKGLCPICGKNLNVAKCSCQPEELDNLDNPFSKLKN